MFDVAVLGGGPGGYKVAELLSRSGKKIILIEENRLGGVCLNQGCIPFKSYLHNAQVYGKYRSLSENSILSNIGGRIDLERLKNHVKKTVVGLRTGLEIELKHHGVNIVYGHGFLHDVSDERIVLKVNDSNIECKKMVIATGSCEKELEIMEYPSKTTMLNSSNLFDFSEIPEEIDVIGGGAVGLEIASFFSEIGSSVTVIEAADTIGGNIDKEIADVANKLFNRRGINILTNTILVGDEDGYPVYQNEKECITRKTHYIFKAIGRRPSIDVEMLTALGVDYNDDGIVIDDTCRTTNNNVYACGDVTGKLMLAHTAYKQARVISESINGKNTSIDYCLIPKIVYSSPQLLSVGLSEEDCQKRNIDYHSVILSMTYNGKYFAEYGKDGSKAKMLADKDNRILGIHIVANDIAELAFVAEFIICNRITASELEDVPIAHPTYGEIIGKLAENIVHGR